MEKTIKIVVKTFFGLEEVLQEELNELGYESTEKLNRAVQLTGTWKDVYRINLHARCALSVLVELRTFQLKEENDLQILIDSRLSNILCTKEKKKRRKAKR